MNALVLSVLVMGAGTGALIDVARRRIPNAVVAATAAAGLVLAFTGASNVSPWSSLLGLVAGLLLMLPGYLLAATGAGDVKLFAAVGAVLGTGRIVDAFLATLIVGGALAVGVALRRGRLTRALARTTRLLGQPGVTRHELASDGTTSFPYGPAIAAGAVIAAMW